MKQKIKGKKKYKHQLENKLVLSSIIFWGGLIVALPFVYYPDAQDPVLVPQLFAASVFLLGYFLVSWVFTRDLVSSKIITSDILLFFAYAYILLMSISSFSAVNLKEGLFDISKTLLFVLVIIFSLKHLERNPNWIKLIPVLFLLSATFMLIIGYYQYFTLVLSSKEKFLPNGLAIIYSVEGLMAHKNLYASALFLTLPFVIWGIFLFKDFLRTVFIVVTASTLIMLVLLSTRAVWLGVLTAMFFIAAVLILKGNWFGISTKYRFYVFAAGLLLFSVVVIYVSKNQSTTDFSVVERFKSIFDPESSNNKYRINAWDATLEVWSDKPVLGVGPGNWKIIVPREFHKYNFTKEQLNWNRPHNDFLWVLSEKGILGFIAYIGLFVTAFIYLFRAIGKSEEFTHKVLGLLLGGGFLGYLTISSFDFPLERVYHQIILAVWFSVAIFLKGNTSNLYPFKKFQASVPLLILSSLLFIVIYSSSSARLEIIVKKTINAQLSRNWSLMYDLAKMIPVKFRNIDANSMPVYYYHGLANEKLKDYKTAQGFYLQALHDHPSKIEVMNNLGLIYFYQKDDAKAVAYFEMALKILPDYVAALFNLSTLYGNQGDYLKSLECLEKIPKDKWDDRFLEREEVLKKLIDSE